MQNSANNNLEQSAINSLHSFIDLEDSTRKANQLNELWSNWDDNSINLDDDGIEVFVEPLPWE